LLSVKKYTSYLICFVIIQPVFFIGFLLLTWKFSSITLASVFYCIALSYILTIFYTSANIITIKNRKSIVQLLKIDPISSETSVWRLSSLKLFALNEFYYVVKNAPIYLIAIVAVTASASGRYNVILMVSNLILCLHTAFVTILTPNISTNIKTAAGRIKLQTLLVTLNRCLLIFGLILLAIIVIFAHDILNFFGKGYEDLDWALIIYSALLFVKSFFSNSYYILEYSNNTKINMIGYTGLFILTLTAGVYFGHRDGVSGMLIAVGVSQVIVNIYYWAYTKIVLNVNACALW
jgi:O-antigen/teichoic acid export membrane protein